MKKIWNKFQSLAVAKKLLALSLVMSIVPICCILVLNYQLSGSVVRTQTGELIQANLLNFQPGIALKASRAGNLHVIGTLNLCFSHTHIMFFRKFKSCL